MFEKQNELLLPSISTFLSLKSDTNNNQYKYGETTCRCLFGPPDTLELREVCEKQEQLERERLLNRWGIDWKTGQLVPIESNNHVRSITSSSKHKTRKAKRLQETQQNNLENIENKYPTDSIIMKSVREIDMLQENIRQPFTVMTNRTNLLARSVRKNLFPSTANTSQNDENSTVNRNVPVRSSINKPYNKQLQITDFWRIRKSPPVPGKMDTKKVLTETRKSPTTATKSRRKLNY
ncbi:uncharacterized protein LOC123297382 [Chrysoperla carnea]|uniref:uncharacterized protein LOC123297382 n=1 Tax=Chrysoperla carnea TaxID=189513 RepID=UPI001D08D5F8|nr:uncharacterized protein LOC123297382 [Chrysoperla carnea]